MNNKELKQVVLDDLARSGLTTMDFKKMRLTPCDADRAEAVLNSSFATHGYVLPYFDIHGKLIDVFRFRFTSEIKNKEKKVVKYSQLKGTDPHLYFSPCIKWKKILTDPSITVTFTEGEKKAYKACKEDIPTIGLGGVWAFRSKKLRKMLIDDFKHITLQDRKVLLCFDNDSQSNPDVMNALRAFSKVLSDKGAVVFNKKLPFNSYQKIGLDDYLLDHSKRDYNNIQEDQFDELTEIDELSSEVAYIREVGKFYLFKDNLFINRTALIDTKYANRTTIGEDGKSVSVAELWVRSLKRREHIRLAYSPGQPEVTENNEYNLWKGWGCVPKKGSIKIFLDAVKIIFNNDKILIAWFLDWVAYPIQNPGAKMLTGVLLQSIEHGTGKSSIGMTIGAMYGHNYRLVDDSQMNRAFNEWAVNKQFILGDEISGKDNKRGEADKIKNLITRPEVTLEKKWQPSYTVKDCIQYLFTSNHVDALSIDPGDRRWFVYRVLAGLGFSLKMGVALENFRNGGGTAHLLHYFINEHRITKGFDHRADAPMTQAKQDLIDHSLTDIERFLVNIRTNPDFALSIDGVNIDRDLYTTGQVISLYQIKNPRANVTETAMGKALTKIFDNVYVVRTRSSGTQRLRALRNLDKWKSANHKQIQEHYDRSKIALFEAKKRKHKT